ncbi:MAG TPA: ComEC/Rec2 family competence protein [Sphingomicrobium sp.]|nr:ComEC/Rec2 family competence protein [Sphingomicrobium sp.]
MAPLPQRARGFWKAKTDAVGERLERLLEAERAQLAPWFVVGFGGGIAAWFALPSPAQWAAFLCFGSALGVAGFVLGSGRSGRAVGWFSLAAVLGCALIWLRAGHVASPRLSRPAVVSFQAEVEGVETLVARDAVRLTLAVKDARLPPRVRVSVNADAVPAGLTSGAVVKIRARLAPPPPMALPGTYDFARDAWFRGIGAVGRALGPVQIVRAGDGGTLESVRERLGRHIREQLPGSEAGIAVALVTGDQNSVGEDDAEAMRASGLTHLLSVSGLHIAAVVGFAMLLSLKLLALSERLASRFNLVLVSAGVAAAAGIAYTLLTGAQVPTVRSCVAAVLVLLGIGLGRDAISIRLVAVGALVVLAFRPEALAGASFQMSFAAVTAIVALHSTPWARRLFQRRDEGLAMRCGRALMVLVLTGLAVELALIPLALFHFHRTGLYGVAANIIAIPLTTFVIMPLEASALLLDAVGAGRPLWALTGWAIAALLRLAHGVADSPGAVAMLPSMPRLAFGLMVAGGLWLCLWTRRWRRLGLIPAATGAILAWAAPAPDLLITGDGRHLVVLAADGTPLLLRDRTGDFVRKLFAEASGYDGDPDLLAGGSSSVCSRDACVAIIRKNGREWRLLATRSPTRIDWSRITQACATSDIVVSDRRLPRGCTPRWLKLDRAALARSGGVAIYVGETPRVATVAERVAAHHWAM